MSLIRKHGAVLQAWACLDLVTPTRECSTLLITDHASSLYLHILVFAVVLIMYDISDSSCHMWMLYSVMYGGTQRPPPQKLTPLFPHKLTPLFPREFTGKEWSEFLGRWPLCTTVDLCL